MQRTANVSPAAVDILSLVREYGVVGAGGAGFPAHAKLANAVDTIIANGAECEPILEVDKYLMVHDAEGIIRGLKAVMAQVGASRGIVAIKEKNTEAAQSIERAVADKPDIEVVRLANTYPAGDEMVLIRQVTGRIVPAGGLPFMAGVTVSNVATLKQIADALDGKPVISRLVTVGGAVARPLTTEVPMGASIRELIEFAGGATCGDYEVVLGGPIMGTIGSADDPVTKTLGGIIVLPPDHTVIRLKRQPVRITKLRAKMCCTCQECTILCPRNAMGHPISPAKIMSYSWLIDDILLKIETGNLDPFTEEMISEAMLCCQCGICEQYACIFGLSPNKVYAMVKDAIVKAGLKFDFSKRALDDSMFDHRKISAKKYALKLELGNYLGSTEYVSAGSFIPERVSIPLKQHIGTPCTAAVKEGDTVNAGDVIGEVPSGALGAQVHASINGRVVSVTDVSITIGRSG